MTRIKRSLTLGSAQINVMTDRSVRYVIGPCNSINHLYDAPMDKAQAFARLLDHYGYKLSNPYALGPADVLVLDLENTSGLTRLMLRRMDERTRIGWIDHSRESYDYRRAAQRVDRIVARLTSRACTR